MKGDIIDFLRELSNDIESLREVRIKEVIDNGILVLKTEKGSGKKLVGKRGRIVKELSRKFNKPVRVIEEGSSFKNTIKNLFEPAPVVGINTLYIKDERKYTIRIKKYDKLNLPLPTEDFRRLISKITGKSVRIVFE